MNRTNLETLATYLEALPIGYEHFDMASYLRKDDRYIYMVADANIIGDCGTVACAVGHGPTAGIAATDYENWDDYSDRVFDLSSTEWSWCFSSSWSTTDNTHQGAAKRIRHMLEHGAPDDAVQQMFGEVDYIFATEPA